jgi:hypothetical protein
VAIDTAHALLEQKKTFEHCANKRDCCTNEVLCAV